jgi:DNA (cytosine-5)-methyltransferase 1
MKMRAMKSFPVIDLFAGPGGLSHGFLSYLTKACGFDVKLSIEKDETAHKTLTLRAFIRQFSSVPEEYYRYIRGEGGFTREDLAKKFPKEWAAAEHEVRAWELGKKPFTEVSAAISDALGGAKDWLLIGGPPCQAYSLIGRSRRKNDATFATDHRHSLYREYLKIVAVHQPKVFVMENVKGILSSRHGTTGKEPILFQILEDLRNPADAITNEKDAASLLPKKRYRYRIYSFVNRASAPEALKPTDFLIRSEDWGIPQKRHRVILFGIREDVTAEPKTLGDLFQHENVDAASVLSGLPRLRSRISKRKGVTEDSSGAWLKILRALGNRQVMSAITDKSIRAAITHQLAALRPIEDTGKAFAKGKFRPKKLADWFVDEKLNGVIQHTSRSHMPTDLVRYFYAACYAAETGKSPTLAGFPEFLLPDHRNAKTESDVDGKAKKRDFEDRFRVQVKNDASSTVTSHLSKDGHYFIHYDPLQCRSITVREAARLQTFPDSYFFEGERTAQYHQVGNAVPPLLASKLAAVVADLLVRSAELTSMADAVVANVRVGLQKEKKLLEER